MFGSEILNIATGLIFVYLLLGLICIILNEWIARIFALRSGTLETGIRNLIKGKGQDNKDLVEAFFEHPLIKGLSHQGWCEKIFRKESRPSYIPSREFALALMDILPADKKDSRLFKDISKSVAKLPESDTREALLLLISEVEKKDLKAARENIEKWFNSAMDRVSGWYKRKIQLITFCVALVVSVGLNVDTFVIANNLYRDDILRASVVATALETAKQSGLTEPEISLERIEQVQEELLDHQLPMGWTDPRQIPQNPRGWLNKILGLLFTTLAVSLGAPFWFDMLNKFVNLRSVGKKPGGSEVIEES
ncbi:hypothetical protein KAW18_04525 [candidate division WOR-3 bacterium]|nr:hypothetical protein [candidate division WOR-3 bacterium]